MVYLYFNISLFQYFCGQYNQVFFFQFCDIENLPKKFPKNRKISRIYAKHFMPNMGE